MSAAVVLGWLHVMGKMKSLVPGARRGGKLSGPDRRMIHQSAVF